MTRDNRIFKFWACILLFCSPLFAQQELLGTYSGTYEFESSRKRFMNGLELQITSVENGNVTGKLKLIGSDCLGDYAISGKYSNNQLTLLTAAGEKLGCGNTRLVLTVKDGKLVGKYARFPAELSK